MTCASASVVNIADGAFHFTFLPGRANVAGTRHEVIFAGKTKEARIEADKIAVMLGDRRGEVLCAAICNVE